MNFNPPWQSNVFDSYVEYEFDEFYVVAANIMLFVCGMWG
jgi:hypothetical protein